MQILQWLFKPTDEPTKANLSGPTNKKNHNAKDQRAKSKDIVLFDNRKPNRRVRGAERIKLGCSLNPLKVFWARRDIAKTCFYNTLNLKRLGSFRRRERRVYSMKMKKEDIAKGLGIGHKVDSGNKVSPVSDSGHRQCGTVEKKDCSSASKPKGDKAKTISRMKELLRWAAAAKSEKGGKFLGRKVLQLRNKRMLKSVPDDDQLSNDSPKISFRWDLESCSTTTSSAYSAVSLSSSKSDLSMIIKKCPSRTLNWITTDSEFVVLEL